MENLNQTWYTAVPDFSQCFQQIIFVSIPCLAFCLAGIVNLWINSKRTVEAGLLWTVVEILKIALCIILILISILEISLAAYQIAVDMIIPEIKIYGSCSKIMIYALIPFILRQNKQKGIRSSTLLSIFWFIFSICNIIIYRSSLIKIFDMTYVVSSVDPYVLDMIHFPIVLCQFFLSLFNDPGYKSYMDRSFLEDSPFFALLTFSWFNSITNVAVYKMYTFYANENDSMFLNVNEILNLFRSLTLIPSFLLHIWYIYKGIKNPLTVQDFQPLYSKLKANYVWEKFQINWSQFLLKINGRESEVPQKKSLLMFACVLTKSFWVFFTWGVILQIIYDFLIFLPSLLLDKIITFVSENDYVWKGHLYCAALFLADFSAQLIFTFMLFFSALFANQVKSVLISAIYRKVLKLSNAARRQYTSGEMVNLMSVDVENLYLMSFYSNLVVGAPIKLCLTVILLWQYLGPSCLAGGVLLILMMLFGYIVAKKTRVVQEEQMETKDTRLKFMNELLNGIKVLKLYAWEVPFMDRISQIRQKEVNLIRKFQLLYTGTVFVWCCTPFFVALASIVTYLLVDEKNVFDATVVFVSMNLLNILRNVVLEIPELTAQLVQAMVSLRRLLKFLTSEEHDQNVIGNSCDPGEAISVHKGVFAWSTDGEPTLKGIDFHVPKGSLVAVIGPVGAGKSSLMSAILGEMYTRDGSVNIEGTVSYVPQQAWILNRSLKENILFVSKMSKIKYDTVLDSCCLKPDLEILPGGDKTEIGEKGVNLSGGQKQRVSLARSVFHDADVYLFDDPLSAVDSHVGKHIFEHVVGGSGILKDKTRILVTHNISFLPETDFIVTMKDGQIQEAGTYGELMKNKGVFNEFIEEHMNVKGDIAEVDKSMLEAGDNLNPTITQSINNHEPLLRSLSVESTHSGISTKLVDEENMEIGQVKKTVYINYAKHIGCLLFSGVILGSLGSEALEIGGNVWLSKWSEDIESSHQDVSQRNYRIIIFTVLGISRAIVKIFSSVCLAYGSAKAAKQYHREMLHSIMRAPMSFFDTTPLGRIVNRFGRDIDDVDTGIPIQLDNFIACIFYAAGTFIVLGISTPLFFAFLLPVGLAYYGVQHCYLVTSRQLKRLSSTTRSPVYSHFTETVSGTSSIRAYKVEKYFITTANEKINTNAMCHMYWSMCNRWLAFHISLIGEFVVLTASLLALESKDIIGASTVALSITFALSVTEVLTWIVHTGTELENKYVSVERIEEYSNLSPEAPWNISESSPPSDWPRNGSIEFKSYSARYREGLNLVIKNISLRIEEHEKVGIVGRTGAGKSSFALALFRIIEPAHGTTLIDGIDVSKIGLHQLRSKLTIIPQDPVLFTGLLRMNLDPDSTHSDAELWSSLESAHLKNFVSSLTEGLNFEVAEGGENLSVGQRQLICLARALLKQAKILILDEATAAVDMDTDRLIQNTIRSEFKDYTIITIAHRLNTIMDYDKVVVMNAGEIAEIGSPSELLQRPESHFYSMAKDAGLV